MNRYVLRRVALSVVTLFLLVTIVFLIVNVFPADPGRSIAGPFAPQATVDKINDELGTNDPLGDQYGRLLRQTATFEFGDSYQFKRPVGDLLWPALGRSAKLVVFGLVLTVPVAIAAGVFAARRRNTIADRSIVTLGLASSSIPEFVSGVTLQYLIGVKLGWFPTTAGARPSLYGLILPALVLGAASTATMLRLTRASVAENVRADYVRTARAKGLSARRVVAVHVLRNSMIPVITLIGVDLGTLMAGAIITEGVFNIPGVGSKLLLGIQTEDGPLVVGFVSVLVVVFLVTNLLVDLLYAVLDQRIRYE